MLDAKQKTEPKPLTEPRELKVIPLDRQVNGVRFSPCGKYLAASGFDALVRLWRWDTEKIKEEPKEDPKELPQLAGHRGWVTAMAFAPKGELLFTVDSWGGVIAWPFEKNEVKPQWQKLDAHDGWVRSATVSEDGKHLLTGGHDGFVRVVGE